MIKVVLFDIDNTLLDFDAYVRNSMKDGFRMFNLGPYEESMFLVFEKINTEMWRRIGESSLTYEELLRDRWNKIFSVLDIHFDGCRFEKYFREQLFDSAIPVDGATALLERLKERFTLGIASNGPYEQQMNRLARANMLPYFSKIFISEKLGVSKPSPEFFSLCLDGFNADRAEQGLAPLLPEEVVMIGDSLSADMAGAIDFGMKTCFFDKNRRGDHSNLPIDYVVDSLDEISAIL